MFKAFHLLLLSFFLLLILFLKKNLHLYVQKEVTFAWNPSNRKFLIEKKKIKLEIQIKKICD